jgi:hypothetical protein
MTKLPLPVVVAATLSPLTMSGRLTMTESSIQIIINSVQDQLLLPSYCSILRMNIAAKSITSSNVATEVPTPGPRSEEGG